ncbi:thioredoxin family protein [Thiohalophilus thiocyanatoxydans]|uniref:Thioredoxin-related protein n=1 Tax=Thiohalophilus thiocyanatoxydans TaxID=381308 RepID=A0A4R8ISR1_9GAMM|nr:thioredoxin fold domain-containing protein [Thiohalophilus thiocyanatoxydans]TDY00599.1 thioredoxin-related protein [Thiohalophilus thiocyanatoxydans]
MIEQPSVLKIVSRYIRRCLLFLSFATAAAGLQAQNDLLEPFSDRPLEEPVTHPDWFKLSFLDLYDDIEEAVAAGKEGIIVYFGQEHCPYCKAHLQNNWENPEIVKYTRDNFDVIAVDVKGARNITAIDGKVYQEKSFAIRHQTDFTPSLLFYNAQKEVVLKLQGYHPPYQFRAALEYVNDQHYANEPFGDYLSRAELAESYGKDRLNAHPAFASQPYVLDRSSMSAARPLAVFFEQPRCHACDVLHAGPLDTDRITARLKQMDVVQLDMQSDTRLITPDGRRLTARQWADELDLYYSPTVIFFDENGNEILRINSVVWVYRLNNVLDYILTDAYKRHDTYQAWQQFKVRKKSGMD